jgi:hypothetical protein
MASSAKRTLLLLVLIAALPLLGNADGLIGIPRSLADIAKDIVAAGRQQFGDCKLSGTPDVRAAALSATAIETFKRGELETMMEWLAAYFGTIVPEAREDVSLGSAQIKLPTARKFVVLPDEVIAGKLLSDPCWSLQLAAKILAERIAGCPTETPTKECVVAAASVYNGQKRLSGPNVAYRVVFLRVYNHYANAH